MQFVDFYMFMPILLALLVILVAVTIFTLKMRIDIAGLDTKVTYYSDRVLPLLVQNTILYRLSMSIIKRLFTVDQIKNIKDEMANDFVKSYKIDLAGKRPDNITLQWINALIEGIDAFFVELADLAPDSDLLLEEDSSHYSFTCTSCGYEQEHVLFGNPKEVICMKCSAMNLVKRENEGGDSSEKT